jgi:peptidoglycan hydrolase CwlO-like protein
VCIVNWNTKILHVKIAINMTTEILLLISNVVTGVAGFFVGKRRSDAETDNQVLKNLELSINLYKQMIDDLKAEIHELNNKVQHLQKMVDELMLENRKLKNKNTL